MVEIHKGPAKIFVESGETRIINGIFYMNLQSGEQTYGFVIPLPLAKALGPAMMKQVGEMEEKTGQKFDGGQATETIPSPWGPTAKKS